MTDHPRGGEDREPLLTMDGIASRDNVSHAAILSRRKAHPDFPAPDGYAGKIPWWYEDTIDMWLSPKDGGPDGRSRSRHDPALGIHQAARRVGLRPSTLRFYRHKGLLPEHDGTFGVTHWWYQSTIDHWSGNRPGRGYRTDLHNTTPKETPHP